MRRLAGLAMVVVALVAPFPARSQDKPILAVMEIEDKTGKFSELDLQTATEFLSSIVVTGQRYLVVERNRHNEKRQDLMRKLKRTSHDPCFDRGCRVELGRALAADSLLACGIGRLGKTCMLTCNIILLEKEVSGVSAISQFDCGPESLPDALKQVARELNGAPRRSEVTGTSERPVPGEKREKEPPGNSGTPEPEAASGFGFLTVRSNPEGALVRVDGTPIGKTPINRKSIPARTIRLMIGGEEYAPITKNNIRIVEGEVEEVEVNLTSNNGHLIVEAFDSAGKEVKGWVLIDSKPVGNVPFVGEVTAGRRTVEVQAFDGETRTTSVVVRMGHTEKARLVFMGKTQ